MIGTVWVPDRIACRPVSSAERLGVIGVDSSRGMLDVCARRATLAGVEVDLRAAGQTRDLGRIASRLAEGFGEGPLKRAAELASHRIKPADWNALLDAQRVPGQVWPVCTGGQNSEFQTTAARRPREMRC